MKYKYCNKFQKKKLNLSSFISYDLIYFMPYFHFQLQAHLYYSSERKNFQLCTVVFGARDGVFCLSVRQFYSLYFSDISRRSKV
jgi:hypothetical protein